MRPKPTKGCRASEVEEDERMKKYDNIDRTHPLFHVELIGITSCTGSDHRPTPGTSGCGVAYCL
jgi:hypothetical protein